MDSILVAELRAKEIVYTTVCTESQLLVEISKVQTLRDWHDVIKYLDGSIDIAKGCLRIGSFIFPEAAPVLLFLAGVGTAVQFVLGKLPDDRPDPVVVKLKELEQTVHEVEKQMNVKFADMKAFITESEFAGNIISEVAVLMKLMRNCLVYQNKESMETFRSAYQKKSPLSLVYIMMSYLEQKTTNPLAMNMETEGTVDVFDKWEDIIKGLLGELIVIEGFASGLLKENNSFDGDRLLERSSEIFRSIHSWREEYGYSKYWAEMKAFLEDYISKSEHLSNADKADEIKRKLETFSTNDSFYICVFNEAQWQQDYNYHCPKESTQLIGSFNKGNCTAIVYRSRKANQLPNAVFDNSEKAMKDCHEYVI